MSSQSTNKTEQINLQTNENEMDDDMITTAQMNKRKINDKQICIHKPSKHAIKLNQLNLLHV